MEASRTFLILGPVAALDDNGAPLRLGGLKVRALLARLALSADRVVSIDALMEDVWNGAPPKSARAALHVHLSSLRRAIGEDRIVTEANGYRLSVAPSELDALRFEALVAAAHRQIEAGQAADAARTFRDALGLWRGGALADVADLAFAQPHATRLEESRLAALEGRVDADLVCGRHSQLAGELEILTARHPLRERLWSQRILALYRCDRQAEALRAYQEVRTLLGDQLGLEPGPALRALEGAVLGQDRSLDWKAAVAPQAPVGVPPVGKGRVPVPAPLSTARDAAFIGRAPEMERLRDGWAAARAGERQVLFVTGDAGIGKTSIVGVFARHAHAEGATVLLGRCNEEVLGPYEPFVEALRHYVVNCPLDELRVYAERTGPELTQLVPELGSRLGIAAPATAENGDRYRLFESVGALIADLSQAAPVVLVLEDMHWADAGSALLFRHLCQQTAPAALLVIATYREVEVSSHHPLAAALSEFHRTRVGARVHLDGLTVPEVVALLSRQAGYELDAAGQAFADQLWRQTEGNPFFIEEVIRHLAEAGIISQRDGRWTRDLGVSEVGIPEGVKDVVGRRLDHLSATARHVLALASVIGREFQTEVLEAIAGDSGAVLDSLEEAAGDGLVAEVPRVAGRYTFTHTLIRETLYSGLSLIRRVRTHALVGGALERLYAVTLDDHIDEVAFHFLRAATGGDLDKTLGYVIGAGERALAKLAYEEAAQHFEQGLELIETADAGDAVGARRAPLLLALGDAQRRAGDTVTSQGTFRAAATLARQRGDADLLGRAALGFAMGGGGLTRASRADDEIIGLLRDALEAGGEQPTPLRVRLAARLSEELYFTGSAERSALGEEAVAMAEQIGDRTIQLVARYAYEYSRIGPDFDPYERFAALGPVVTLADELGDRELAYQLHLLREMAALEGADPAAADIELAAAAAIADSLNIPGLRPWVTAAQSRRAWLAGRFAEAEQLNSDALTGATTSGDPEVAMLAIGGQAMAQQILRGDLTAFLPVLRDFADLYPQHPLVRCFLAYAAAEVGHLDDARIEFEQFAATRFDMPRTESWLDAMWALARCCARLGDVERATLMYDLLLPCSGRWLADRAAVSLGPSSTLLGILAGVLQDENAAIAHFEEAMARAEAFGSPPWLADAQVECATLLVTSPDVDRRRRGIELGRAALETAETLGMARLADKARAVGLG